MESLKIYRNNVVVYELKADYEFSDGLGHDAYQSVTISSKEELDFRIGDYILIDNVRFEIFNPIDIEESNGVFTYQLVFYYPGYKLNNSIITDEKATTFPYYGGVEDFMILLIQSLQSDYPEFSMGTVEENGIIELSFDNSSCMQALKDFCEAADMEYRIENTTINVRRRIGGETDYVFSYGKKNGGYSVKLTKVANTSIVTRMIGKGGTQNLPSDYVSPDSPRRLNLGDEVLEKNVDKYGRITGVYVNDNIFPRLVNKTVLEVTVPENIDTAASWKIKLDIPFDLSQQYAKDQTPTISFQTGDLTGNEFEVEKDSWDNTEKTLSIIVKVDDNYRLPNKDRQPRPGDVFTILNINLPPVYLDEAIKELRKATQDDLDRKCEPQYAPSIVVSKRHIKKNKINLSIGDGITIKIGSNSISTRIVGISKSSSSNEINYELGDQILYSYDTKTNNTIEQIQATLKQLISIDDIKRLFYTLINAWYPKWFNQPLHTYDPVRFARVIAEEFTENEIVPDTPVDPENPDTPTPALLSLTGDEPTCTTFTEIGQGDEPQPVVTTIGALSNVSDNADIAANGSILVAENGEYVPKLAGSMPELQGPPGPVGGPGPAGPAGPAGQNGHSPVITVGADTDGKLYWKIDGEWLLYNGEKVPAAGSTEPPVTSLGSLTNVEGTVDDAVTDDVVLYREIGSEVWKKKAVKDIFVQTGLQRNVRVVNNLDSKSIAASKGEPCLLNFTFVSQERYSSDEAYEDTGERGLLQISARSGDNAEYVVVKQMYINSGSPFSIDVAEFLTSGANNIMIKVTGEVTEVTTPAFVYTVTLTSLSISADNFRWWTAYTGDVTLPLSIGGNISKILHVTVTGKDYNRSYEVQLGTSIYVETAYNYVVEHPGVTGVYKISAYVSSVDGIIRTRMVSFNVMCVVAGERVKLVAVNNVLPKATNWTENALFDYAMYDGDEVTTAAQFVVKKEGMPVFTSNEDSITTSSKHTFNFPMEIETIDASEFEITAHVMDGETALIEALTFGVNNSSGFSAMPGAVFYLNPRTRSNRQENRLSVINEMDQSIVACDWKGMNWGNDGWTTDAEGNKVLRVMAGAQASVGYKPFAKEAARTGKTIEIDFKSDCVTDFSHPVLKIATASGEKFVGLHIYPDDVVVYSTALKDKDNQSINIYEAKRVRMTLVIMPDAYGNSGFNLCIVYINGVKNRAFTYENNDYFAQNGNIVIGSDYADVDVYGIRIYDLALTSSGVLRNNINWLPSKEEKGAMQDKNDVMDTNGSEIDYEKVKAKYNVFVIQEPVPSLLNPNVLETFWRASFADHPEWNWEIDVIDVGGQGTSSKRYLKWNLRGKYRKQSVATYADGSTTVGYVNFTPTIRKVKKLTAKKNFASPMHSHKMGSVNSIDDLANAMNLMNAAGGRIATYQLPFVGFSMSVNEEGEEVYTFIGLYTFGPDKGNDATFGYDTDQFPNLLSIEGSDNAPLMALFRVPWDPKKRYIAYNPDEEALQYNGTNCWDYDAGAPDSEEEAEAVLALFEKNWMPTYNFVYECSPRLAAFAGDAIALNEKVSELRNSGTDYWITGGDVYYFESAEGKFIPAETHNGKINLYTQLVDKGYGLTTADVGGKSAGELNDLFIKARIQKFRQEVQSVGHMDVVKSIFARNWVEFNAATDNRTKNTYPHIFGSPEDGYLWEWRHDDMDTIWPITNQGLSKKGYGVEVGDKYENGGSVWNGETSNFWNLLDLAFPDEVVAEMKKFMAAMEKLGGMTTGTSYDKIYAFFHKYYFKQAQEYFCQNLYNADAKWTHEQSKLAYIAGDYTNDTDPITQLLGDLYSAEQRWIRKRILYMMSKYSYGLFSADGTDNITVRAAGDKIMYAITPAMDMYPAIANGTSIIRGARTKAGEVCRMEVELGGSGDQQNAIQGASYLEDIGDWYDKNVTGTMIIQGRMLREIRLGHKTEPIVISISTLTLSNCVSLQKLILSRIATLSGTLNLMGCTHLKEVSIDGTGVTQLRLPEGGGLEKVEFNSLSQYLILKNYPLLRNEGVVIDECKAAITDFLIVDCPLLRPVRLLVDVMNAQADQGTEHVLKRIRAVGFEETYNTSEMLDKLAELADGSYSGLNSEGLAGEDEYPVLDGTLTIYASAYEDSVEALRNTFRKLTLNVIGEFYVRFRDKVVQDICVSLWGDGIGVTRSELASVTKLSNTAFQGNTEITSFDELEYLTGIVSIDESSFKYCNALKSIILPLNVQLLKTDAFNNTGLESIIIPRNVTSIGGFCFYNSKLKNVVFEERTKTFNIYSSAFERCSDLKSVIFPDLARYNPAPDSESNSIFRDCASLTSVHLPESPEITYIPKRMFWGCKSLIEFNIGPYITRIGDTAFAGCSLITRVDLSQTNITSLGVNTFDNCGLSEIIFNDKITSIGKACFAYCQFESFEFPETVTVVAQEVLRWNRPLKHVTLHSGVTEIGTWAFASDWLDDLVCLAPTPPTLGDDIFAYGGVVAIYVPDESVEAYKAAPGWANYANKIYPLSEKPNN